jgi:HD-like signal output (HDOD) protein
MKIALTILFILVIIPIIYVLMNQQKKPIRGGKKKSYSSKRSLPDQNKPAPSSLHKKSYVLTEPLRESVNNGFKSILSGGKFEFLNESLPLKYSDIPPDLHKKVKNCIGDMRDFSSVYKISNLLDEPQVDLSKIAKVISTDPILSNKLLRTANSAFFGAGKTVDSINHALALLGFVNIKSILFLNALSKKFPIAASDNPFTKELWKHMIKTAYCAAYLSDAFEGLHKGKLYTLGLLHDIGKFVLPELAQGTVFDPGAISPYGGKESILQEDALLGINHAVIGRIALEDSGISEQLTKVIEFHHFPLFTHKSFHLTKEEDQKYLTALYLANQIAKLFVGEDEKQIFAAQPLPPSYQGLINLSTLNMIMNDERVLNDILRSGSLIE